MVSIQPKRFTVSEFHRLAELNFFNPNEPVELIRGEILQMAPKRTPHSVCNTRLAKKLILLLGDRAIVRSQEPIILPEDSEPSPDVTIARNREDEYLANHPEPEDILLVIEISDSTLKYDRETKLALYAEHGLPHYWIFNLVDYHLEAYSEPYQDNQGKFGYRVKQIYLPHEVVSFLVFSELQLNLETVFPGHL